jgi:hypothetical protein
MLSQHVKTQGRAFSLFDAARLVLAGPERHRVKVECEAERLVGLFQVPSDGSLFETREEATRHLLKNAEALAELYREEQIELEEPKGVFTSVAVCGMSGEVLGPPSHHSFQTALKRLHTARYSSLPFEEYRRRVRTETTPEFIDKWKEQQRKGTRWIYLKDVPAEGAEPLSFSSRAEFEAHFRTTHADSAVIETREAVVHAKAIVRACSARQEFDSQMHALHKRGPAAVRDAKSLAALHAAAASFKQQASTVPKELPGASALWQQAAMAGSELLDAVAKNTSRLAEETFLPLLADIGDKVVESLMEQLPSAKLLELTQTRSLHTTP